jgi:D-alanyl-lipoteichoic acid acyltransferase DltB (MBOAT superfamily)
MSPYPIGYQADYAEERSRLTTFFRLILAIPVIIVGAVYAIGAVVAIVIAWFALLFTGRYPEGLYNFSAGVLRYTTRMNAYTRLLTDVYPPFDMGEHPEYPVRVAIAPARESYNRVKVLFRIILAIPVMLISYALNILVEVCSFLAWVLIVVTGKQNKSLQDAINLGTGYAARAGGYFSLMTEDWPPFSIQEAPATEVAPTA